MEPISTANSLNTDDEYSFWYSVQQGESERNSLTVDSNRNITGHIQNAGVGSVPRELGWYYIENASSNISIINLLELIKKNELADSSRFSITPFAGMRSKIFQFQYKGKKATNMLNAQQKLPQELAEVEKHVESLYKELGVVPLRTFSMTSKIEPNTVKPGKEALFEFQFISKGKFDTEVRNPASFRSNGTGFLKINLWKTESNKSSDLEYVTTINVDDYELLIAEKEALKTSDAFMTIPKNSSIKIWANIRIPKLEPAIYAAEAIYSGASISQEEIIERPNLLTGEYQADLFELSILEK